MAEKTPVQNEDQARIDAEKKQTAEERARQEFERGPDGDANRVAEDLARYNALGSEPGPGGPPATEEPKSFTELYPDQLGAPTKENVIYTVPLAHAQIPVGPPVVPHPTKTITDNMGVSIPPLPADQDHKSLFVVGGKWVNSDGVPIDQIGVKPAIERVPELEQTIADLQRQIADMRGKDKNQNQS